MKLKDYLSKIPFKFLFLFLLIVSAATIAYLFNDGSNIKGQLASTSLAKSATEKKLEEIKIEFEKLKNQDQYKRNEALQKDMDQIVKTYQGSLGSYEKILDLQQSKVNTTKLNTQFAQVLKYLSEKNYASASSSLATLDKDLDAEKNKLVSSFKMPENIVSDNKPPSSGYRRQSVQTEAGTFMVDIISADLNSTRVIVDTASESDCGNDCPVLSLADYVGRSGAFAGINGPFFCPATYPQCAGKTNSFDTLLMNKNKKYFNSDNNVYSTVPAVIFSGNSARFVARSLEWGRDTGVDAVIANYPLYLSGGQSQFSGSSDPKIINKGSRTFIGINGSTVYIGIIYNASSSEVALVLKTLGLQDALGLDQGGSTALWFGGYKAGPGRGLPSAILFVKK